MADFKKEVEAILFAAGRVVTMKELQKLLHLKDPGLIKETVRELKQDYDAKDSPLVIIAEGEGDEISGWKLTVREKMLPLIHKINPHTELSKSILETLAVITWKQPIVQSDVIRIRTNKAYDHIAELERMGFIAKKRFGRSYSISVTQKFLDYFDLKDNKEIKELFKDFKDVEVAVKNKKAELEKAAPEDKPAESEDSGSSADVPEDGVELEPYIDVLPEETKPKREDELEVYNRDEEDIARDMMEEDLAEQEHEGEEGEGEEGEESPEEETEEEKARRIARELVADEEEAEKEEEEREERELHPQLEEFIASSEEHNKPKGSEDHSEEIQEKEEEDEDEEGDSSDKSEKDSEHEESDEEHEKPAEEFPGQFDSEDAEHASDEDQESDEDKQ